VEHKKIMTTGHKIPSQGVIADFFSTVDAFLARDDTSIIGKIHTPLLTYLLSVFRIRIRIWIRNHFWPDLDPDPEGKKPTKIEKVKKSQVLKCWQDVLF
jgi:hypothetical protein